MNAQLTATPRQCRGTTCLYTIRTWIKAVEEIAVHDDKLTPFYQMVVNFPPGFRLLHITLVKSEDVVNALGHEI